ncbi:P-type conjugative transfer protein TrbL [Pseudomonas aeruginosa]|uniref:P-type conjugative transfer protein TrbL n=1 Tax=Pseudomonas aeruginosa TaxID=287 RepID=UPI000ABA8454
MKALHKAALIGVTLALYSTAASAQLTNQGMLDQVVTEFATRATAWQTVVMNAATFLFWTLGTISLVWTFGFMALRKADIGEFFVEFIRFILFFGFFLWLLRNGPAFANSIIQSLARIGEQASGVASVTPSGIVDIGFMILKQAFTNSSIWSPVDSFIGVALSVGILILLAVVAVNMLLLLVSGWLLMYAGIFFLGFGGSRWTSDMAINYYKTVLGVAVQIMTMVLLVGIGNDLLSSFYARMNTGTLNFEELGVMLVFCVALLMLVNRVPPLIAGIISGTGIGNAGGIGNFGAGAAVGAAMGAASVAAGAASMAGAAVMSGAANLAGGASAVKAAFEKAQGSATSDAGAGVDMMASMGGANTSSGQDSAGAGASPFAQAAGFGGSASGGGSTSTGSSSGSSKGGGQGSSSTASTGNGADKAAKNEPKRAGGAGQGQQAAPGSTGPGGVTLVPQHWWRALPASWRRVQVLCSKARPCSSRRASRSAWTRRSAARWQRRSGPERQPSLRLSMATAWPAIRLPILMMKSLLS